MVPGPGSRIPPHFQSGRQRRLPRPDGDPGQSYFRREELPFTKAAPRAADGVPFPDTAGGLGPRAAFGRPAPPPTCTGRATRMSSGPIRVVRSRPQAHLAGSHVEKHFGRDQVFREPVPRLVLAASDRTAWREAGPARKAHCRAEGPGPGVSTWGRERAAGSRWGAQRTGCVEAPSAPVGALLPVCD